MENKPREFRLTVHFDGLIPRIFFNNFVQMSTFKSEEQLHVIEYAAFENLKAENLRLLDESMVQEALKETAEKNLAHCSFVGDRLLEMQNAAIDLAQQVTELESKLKIAVEALSLTATPKSMAHLVYPECLCPACVQKKAIKEIEGSIEKE